MTVQISESIKYNGQERSLLNCPLCHYFSLANIESPFDGMKCTALWRGYTGDWELLNDRLYLTSIQAGFDDDNKTTLNG